ncbi:c-type cytochrome [Spirosoma sp. BT702]|uniref:C-type cytochrome n=1 Tax=Spirosoma profusum TaxID=2771354 RepID=A0A926Y2Z8_9BACT|nr:PVC-type heme-binding CxxCH protein [Spirosoma profusum]MBD2701301.1 c-type cytochrome [Spirosoma profusum]
MKRGVSTGVIVAITIAFGFIGVLPDPHDPRAALATMQVPKGFKVQQFAAEPLVTNPTNMDVDERGRVWVTESHNYDVAPAEFDKKGDKVVILEDVNGDGRADKRTIFFEHPGMKSPMGLLIGEDCVFLAQAPYLLTLFDTNHDDHADRIDTLFSGFGQRDHGIHAPFWGPDGKLYFSMGNNGGEVRDKHGKPILDVAGNPVNGKGNPYRNGLILRCNPDGSHLETIAHNFRNHYEPTLDSFGNLWVSDNDDDGNESVRIDYVMEYGNYGFADEITGAAWTASRTNLEKTVPARHWHQNDPGVIPTMLITGAGSPAGLCVYEGTQFPAIYQNQLLHAEALYNVVRSYTTQKQGAGYTASIRNVLKSSQQWFRPVDVSVAPDGSVMVADWYDPGIGGGTAADANRGRIYRVNYGEKATYRAPKLRFDTPEAATEALKNPNWAARRKAWASLQKMGSKAENSLQKLYQSTNSIWRARALWLLAQLPSTGITYLTQALRSSNPDLRITALRVARQQENFPFALCATLANDPAPEVRREWAIALRFLKTPEAAESWATLAMHHTGKDRWYLEALGIGSDLNADACFDAWQRKVGANWNTSAGRDIVWRLRSAKTLPLLGQFIRQTSNTTETLRYFRAFDFHPSAKKNDVLLSLLDDSRPDIQRLALEHIDGSNVVRNETLNRALETALSTAGQTESYVHLIEKFHLTDKRDQLLNLVRCCASQQVGIEAMQLLWKFGEKEFVRQRLRDDKTAEAIMTALKGNGSPDALSLMSGIMLDETRPIELRKTATRLLGSSWVGERALLDEVKKKSFPDVLKPTASSVLFGAFRNEIKREAADYLPKPAGKNGEPLPPVYLLVHENGVANKGKTIFAQNCQTCHRVQQTGVLFGPELSKIGAKLSKEGLFRAILYPDEGINYGYETYQIHTRDGGQLMGLLGSESNDEVVLKLPGGTKQTLRKNDIRSKVKAPQSMMPPFGEALSKQELVDLVTYLSTLK